MGAYVLQVLIHDEELERFIEAAADPGLAAKVQTGALPDDAFALASVAPYIGECLRRAMRREDT